MAQSPPHPPASTVAAIIFMTVAFIFFLTVPPLCSVMGLEEESKVVIGSRPPTCVNKCNKCRPCMATLVIAHSHHQAATNNKGFSLRVVTPGDDDNPYYLLSWKCVCGHKLFQP